MSERRSPALGSDTLRLPTLSHSHRASAGPQGPIHGCAGALFALQRKRVEDAIMETAAKESLPEPGADSAADEAIVAEGDTIFSPHFHPLKPPHGDFAGATSPKQSSTSAGHESVPGASSPLARCTSLGPPQPALALPSKQAGPDLQPELQPAVTIPNTLGQPRVDGNTPEEAEVVEFDPYLFIKRLPKLSEVVPPFRKPLLPKRTRQCPPKTLVLDLDETLVHSTMDVCQGADFWFPVTFNNQQHEVHVRIRPHLSEFLDKVSGLFEVVVFTASQSVYADKLLNIIDPKRRRVRHRLFRDSCVFIDGNYLKDLSVLGRDLASVIIVDNSPQAFGFQLDNGIPIESWFEDKSDQALLELFSFLQELVEADDVRPAIAARYKLSDKIALGSSQRQ